MTDFTADYSPVTGLVTYLGVTYRLEEWRSLVRDTMREDLQTLCDNRDLASDLQNLPGDKPWFVDTWNYGLSPQTKPTGLPSDNV